MFDLYRSIQCPVCKSLHDFCGDDASASVTGLFEFTCPETNETARITGTDLGAYESVAGCPDGAVRVSQVG